MLLETPSRTRWLDKLRPAGASPCGRAGGPDGTWQLQPISAANQQQNLATLLELCVNLRHGSEWPWPSKLLLSARRARTLRCVCIVDFVSKQVPASSDHHSCRATRALQNLQSNSNLHAREDPLPFRIAWEHHMDDCPAHGGSTICAQSCRLRVCLHVPAETFDRLWTCPPACRRLWFQRVAVLRLQVLLEISPRARCLRALDSGHAKLLHHLADMNLIRFQSRGVELNIDANGSTHHLQAPAHVVCEADVTRLLSLIRRTRPTVSVKPPPPSRPCGTTIAVFHLTFDGPQNMAGQDIPMRMPAC